MNAFPPIAAGRGRSSKRFPVRSTRISSAPMPRSRIPRKSDACTRKRGQSPWTPESHIAARIAAAYRIPFAACRAVIDPVHSELPPAAVIGLRHDGTPDVLAVFRSVVRQPSQLPPSRAPRSRRAPPGRHCAAAPPARHRPRFSLFHRGHGRGAGRRRGRLIRMPPPTRRPRCNAKRVGGPTRLRSA